MAVMAILPFGVLAAVLRQLPMWYNGLAPQGWAWGAANAAVLLALMAWHAASYARWAETSPNRMLVNEFLTRAWLGLFGLVGVGLVGDTGAMYLLMAASWGVASWCVHYLVLRGQGCYRALENLGMLGVYLVGLALIALMQVRIALGGG